MLKRVLSLCLLVAGLAACSGSGDGGSAPVQPVAPPALDVSSSGGDTDDNEDTDDVKDTDDVRDTHGGYAASQVSTQSLSVSSRVFGDTDGKYETGHVVRIDVAEPPDLGQVQSGTITISSASQGYNSGSQPLKFGSIFYEWDTTGLAPAPDYKVVVILTDTTGKTKQDDSLVIKLTPNPPAINKLVSDVDLSVSARGLPTVVARSYLLNSGFNGPMGYGWSHTYYTHVLETPTAVGSNPSGVTGFVKVFNPDGSGSFFKPLGDGTYEAPLGDYRQLTKNPNGTFQLRTKSGTTFFFNQAGKLTGIQDRNQNMATVAYDAQGRVGTVTDPSSQVTTFAYDAQNRVTTITDPQGRTVTYGYDAAGNLITVRNIGGFTTTYAYYANHNLRSVTNPAGRKILFTVYANDRLKSVSGKNGANKVTFQYFVPSPNQMTVTDALGQKTVLTYNAHGLVTKVVDPSGNVSSMAYDAKLNLISATDGNGQVTRVTYDGQGNALTTTDAQGNVTTFTYDARFNQVQSLTDAKGQATTFAHDGRGNLTRMTYPGGSSEAFTHDAAGNLLSKTTRKGETISYTYDGRGNLTNKTLPDGRVHTFAYDAVGNLSSAADESGPLNFLYDQLSRLTKVTYPGGEVLSYEYDAANNRTKLVYPDGTVVGYAYDALNRLTTITRDGQMLATYSYDQLSRVVQRDLENGVTTTYAYDGSSQLTELVNNSPSAGILSKFSYAYDRVGNRVSMTTLTGATQYVYDAISQLTRVTPPTGPPTTYDLDAAGNRTSVTTNGVTATYATNSLNQYTNVGGVQYTYDANGNLTSKTVPATGTTPAQVTTYAYDAENQLIRVSTPAQVIHYTYDPFGRRVSRTSLSVTIKYIHDGLRVVMEKDGGGTVQATYAHGLGIDEVLSMTRSGSKYYYSQDGLGSIVAILDRSGGAVESFAYDEYGVPNKVSLLGSYYMFTGRELDPASNLYYYRARYYDPTAGRFLAVDPLGIKGGTNLYAYVQNNPINELDPLGLQGSPIDACLRQGAVEIGEAVGFPNYAGKVAEVSPQLLELNESLPRGIRRTGTTLGKFIGIFNKLLTAKKIGESYTGTVSCVLNEGSRHPFAPPASGNSNIKAGDPTFVQQWVKSDTKSISDRWHENKGVIARLSIPYANALLRADVPIFGIAMGRNFQDYQVAFGVGQFPTDWTTIARSHQSQLSAPAIEKIERGGDTSVHGNLATWDTGLRSYVYLPSHPKNHPVDLKGTYILRLTVTGKDGSQAEDRVVVHVADVVPNAWGGTAISPDKKVTLTVPEQAIHDSFRLILLQAIDQKAPIAPKGRTLIGSVYEAREPGERFTKPATLTMQYAPSSLRNAAPDHVGIYGYDTSKGSWDYLPSTRDAAGTSISTEVRSLHAYYALMRSTVPGEGSSAPAAKPVPVKLPVAAGLAPIEGHYLVRDTFEDSLGEWANRDGEVGGTVSVNRSATFDGTGALKVTTERGGGNFAVNVRTTPFDAKTYPRVQFDYRIPTGVKTNFLVKVAGRWYDIGFTDDPKVFKDKRVNVAHIGDITGIVADDQWHTAQFNLYDLLRTKTGHTVVEQMVMADWDIGGYMKLQFGHNESGAAYYIDNFSISRSAGAGLALDDSRIVVDHFNQKNRTNALGGTTTIFTDGRAGLLDTEFVGDDTLGKGHALALRYQLSEADSFAGYMTALPQLDVRNQQAVSFSVKMNSSATRLLVGLKDDQGHESKVSVDQYLSHGFTEHWQRVTIPLAAFATDLDRSHVTALTFSIEAGTHSTDEGVVLVDDIVIERELRDVLVDHFNRRQDRNLLSGDSQTAMHGVAAIHTSFVAGGGNAALGISFGGTIGAPTDFDSQLSYAGWSTKLGGLNCSACGTLSFRIKGAEGGERLNLYLDDGTFRWPVLLSAFAPVTTEWQTVTIPLSEFSEYGVDLSHLEELQVMFEWEKMSGTIYLDDIRFGSGHPLVAETAASLERGEHEGGEQQEGKLVKPAEEPALAAIQAH